MGGKDLEVICRKLGDWELGKKNCAIYEELDVKFWK